MNNRPRGRRRFYGRKHFPARCSACLIPLPAEAFRMLSKGGHEFRASTCRPCEVAARRRWAADDPDGAKRERKKERERSERYLERQRARRAVLRGNETPPRRGRSHVWTSAELEIAARPGLTLREAAALIGRTENAVGIARVRIKKEPKFARLAGLDNELARLARPETINVEPRYER